MATKALFGDAGPVVTVRARAKLPQMKPLPDSRGPFRAEQLRSGDPYELSNGHAVYCSPTGARGSKAEGAGYKVLATDPASEDVGIDTGFSPEPGTLRAPDLSYGRIPDEPGWVEGVPRLAVEYADTGQDEDELTAKIGELLTAGTELIWVVRLQGPRRVEVYRPGQRMRIVNPGETLEAPGILKNVVPVEALYDADAANDVALRNLLQRQGYADLEAVLDKGALRALRDDLLAVLEARQVELDDEQRAVVAACAETAVLRRWLVAAATASAAEDVFS